MRLTVLAEHFKLNEPFAISNHVWNTAEVCTVRIERDGIVGQGEGAPVVYHGETAETLVEQVEAVRSEIEKGVNREQLKELLPYGGARCAVDCALWDLEAKSTGTPVHQLAGLRAPTELDSAMTITLKSKDAMASMARRYRDFALLKIKLGGDEDADTMRAIRAAAPNCRLTVDANTAWDLAKLEAMIPVLQELDVELIEQPMPPDADQQLDGFRSPIPIAADESCQTVEDVPDLIGKYQVAVIKLDKAGGLTGAIDLMRAAQGADLGLMVSCMIGTSLGMAPARLIGTYCSVVDLDSPIDRPEDREPPIKYTNGRMHLTPPELWGA